MAEAVDLFADINHPKDPDNMTDLEKKHLPVIQAPESAKLGECIKVTVEVGKLLAHPNEPGHHIEFIDLYEDRCFVARVDLTAARSCPKVTVCIALRKNGLLRVFESCNLHGVWEGTRQVAVTS